MLPDDAQSSTAATTARAATLDHGTSAEAPAPSAAAQALGGAGSLHCATADSEHNMMVQTQSSSAAAAVAGTSQSSKPTAAAATPADMLLHPFLSHISASSSSSSSALAAAFGAEVYMARSAPAQTAAAATGAAATTATTDLTPAVSPEAVDTEAAEFILQLLSNQPPLEEVVAQLCALKAGTGHQQLVFACYVQGYISGHTLLSEVTEDCVINGFALLYGALLHPYVLNRDEAAELRILNAVGGHVVKVCM